MLMIAGSRRLCMWSVYGNSHIWDVDERNLESVSLGRTAVSTRAFRFGIALYFCHLLMSMLRLPGGCIAFVPISPDVGKLLFDARFGLAGLSRDAVMWGDHPRWSLWGFVALIS